jgi:tetratricopeptide (TPR) repeat protein
MNERRRRGEWLLLALLWAAPLAGCFESSSSASRLAASSKSLARPHAPVAERADDSHQRMLAALQEIKEQTAEHHPFLGKRALREAKAALEAAERQPNVDLGELSRLHGAYGEELLRAGETSKAIEQIKKALDYWPAVGDSEVMAIRKYTLYRLAIACLRLGEDANCVHCASGESCLLPIRGAGLHQDKQGSREAVKHLLEALAIDPHDLKARWLLNIAHMTLGGWPHEVPEQFLIPQSASRIAPQRFVRFATPPHQPDSMFATSPAAPSSTTSTATAISISCARPGTPPASSSTSATGATARSSMKLTSAD